MSTESYLHVFVQLQKSVLLLLLLQPAVTSSVLYMTVGSISSCEIITIRKAAVVIISVVSVCLSVR